MEGTVHTNDAHSQEAFSESGSRSEGLPELTATMAGTLQPGVHGAPSVGVLTEDDLPGWRPFTGRDVEPEDVREVIGLLNKAGVSACVVDVYALRYYGAGRSTNEWVICVPDENFDIATDIFKNDARYAPIRPAPELDGSLLHTRPTLELIGTCFYFILVPTSDCFVNPDPDHCELGKGIPYPKMDNFARSLLVMQNECCNLNDFVDGMNLDMEWAELNVDFDNLQVQGLEFTRKYNAELEKQGLGQLKLDIDYRSLWNLIVDEKEKRIEPMKQGRYKSRWRQISNDTDPRTRNRQF